MTSMSKWSRKASYRFAMVAFVACLVVSLAVATFAVAYPDEFGGDATRLSAPYTETYAGTDNIGPHIFSNLVVPPPAQFHDFWGQYLEE